MRLLGTPLGGYPELIGSDVAEAVGTVGVPTWNLVLKPLIGSHPMGSAVAAVLTPMVAEMFKAPVGDVSAGELLPLSILYGYPAPLHDAGAAVLSPTIVESIILAPVGDAPAAGLLPTFT